MTDAPTRALHTDCPLAEGPVWWKNALWFVDILDGALHRFDPDTGSHATWTAGAMLGFAVPTDQDDWRIGLGNAIARWNPGVSKPEIVHQTEPEETGSRYNDGKTDPGGRLYAGTTGPDMSKPTGTLYRVASDGHGHSVVPKVKISNGLSWHVERKAMYYTDTPTRRVDRFDWDPDSGAISNRRPAYAFPDTQRGSPDGHCIDTDGNLWVGLWGGSRVACIDPEAGTEIASIPCPCPNITSCCFGGADHDQLWITSARVGMNEKRLEQSPDAGSIFVATPGARGLPVTPVRA